MKPTIEDSILVEQNVGKALQMLRQRMKGLATDALNMQLVTTEDDYRLMCESFKSGMRDPKGEEVYMDLLRRTYKLYNNVRLASIVRKRPAYSGCYSAAAGISTCKEDVKAKLEDFVQELAMASLFDGKEQEEKIRRAHQTHHDFMEKLFCSLVVAPQWDDETSSFYQEMLLSPTIDQNDALAVISAVTLSLLTVFDICKWNLLVALYENTCSDAILQRALVGMVLTMPNKELAIFGEIRETLQRLCSDQNIRRDLLETQMQLYYSTQTKADTEHIEKDIMPTLIDDSNARILRGGIVENDESMDDIIDASATDRKMAELEEKMDKMIEMQKAGSDVYFGGFSQMKKFPFFWQISNWFTPFYFDHPDLVKVISPDNRGFINAMAKKLPFCDSDKYSFCLALEMMAAKLPSALKEMLSSHPNATGRSNEEYSTPAYIRRKYIQDLYRFFKLNNKGNEFGCPLDIGEEGGKGSRVIFFANPWISQLMPEERADAVQFFFRKRQFGIVAALVEECQKNGKVLERELLALANSYMRLRVYDKAMLAFQQLYSEQKGGQNVMKGLADSMFMLRMFKEAAEIYAKLMLMDGRNTAYVMYHSLSLINSGEAQKGLEDLFRLDYQHPDNPNLKRALAWGYLMDSKPAEAERIYDRLMGEESIIDSDLLNGAYAKWMQSKNNEAVQLLARYSEDGAHDLADDFDADRSLLDLYNIGGYERTIMIDVVERVKQS